VARQTDETKTEAVTKALRDRLARVRRRRLWLTDAPGVHPYPYDVAPDGRILALVPATEGTQQLTVLMTWQAALEP
jgi:hypothetical protein